MTDSGQFMHMVKDFQGNLQINTSKETVIRLSPRITFLLLYMIYFEISQAVSLSPLENQGEFPIPQSSSSISASSRKMGGLA